MSDSTKEKSWIQRQLETPCYRSSMLIGISSGIGSGLVFFLFTSRQTTATRVGFASYISITLASWFYCRYQLVKSQIQLRQFRSALEQKILLEGTLSDPRQREKQQGMDSSSTNNYQLHDVKNVKDITIDVDID